MSMSQYLDEQNAAFAAAHPTADGWKTYACHPGLRERMYLNFLLDFVRDRPEIVTRRQIVGEVRSADMMGEVANSHTVVPGEEWDRVRELDANDWRGNLEIEWQGEPVHYKSISCGRSEESSGVTTLVAAKSNATLRAFHALLAAWGPERSRQKGRQITVVNGEDIKRPDTRWEDLILPPGMANEIRSNVEGFFRSRARYLELGLPHRRGFLLAGAPGCGKTMTIKAIANAIEAEVIVLHAKADLEEYEIDRAFILANIHQPALLIIEDLDRLVGAHKVSVSYFLNMLDGLKPLEGILVLATCNHPEQLDAALLHRPSRFDRVWRFGVPGGAERLALLTRLGGVYFSQGALREAADRSDGFSMAYVQEIVVNALLECAHDGSTPSDSHLAASLVALKSQRKVASKPDEDLTHREDIGFGVRRWGARPEPSQLVLEPAESA